MLSVTLPVVPCVPVQLEQITCCNVSTFGGVALDNLAKFDRVVRTPKFIAPEFAVQFEKFCLEIPWKHKSLHKNLQHSIHFDVLSIQKLFGRLCVCLHAWMLHLHVCVQCMMAAILRSTHPPMVHALASFSKQSATWKCKCKPNFWQSQHTKSYSLTFAVKDAEIKEKLEFCKILLMREMTDKTTEQRCAQIQKGCSGWLWAWKKIAREEIWKIGPCIMPTELEKRALASSPARNGSVHEKPTPSTGGLTNIARAKYFWNKCVAHCWLGFYLGNLLFSAPWTRFHKGRREVTQKECATGLSQTSFSTGMQKSPLAVRTEGESSRQKVGQCYSPLLENVINSVKTTSMQSKCSETTLLSFVAFLFWTTPPSLGANVWPCFSLLRFGWVMRPC